MTNRNWVARVPNAIARAHLPRFVAVAALIACVFTSPIVAAPAQAAVGDLTCTATGVATFTPALVGGGTSIVTTIGLRLSSCVSLDGGYPELTSATVSLAGIATSARGLNPCSLMFSIRVTAELSWSNGEQSRVAFTLSDDLSANPAVSIFGTVTAGKLAGDSIIAVPVVLPNLNCLFTGLTNLYVLPSVITFE